MREEPWSLANGHFLAVEPCGACQGWGQPGVIHCALMQDPAICLLGTVTQFVNLLFCLKNVKMIFHLDAVQNEMIDSASLTEI